MIPALVEGYLDEIVLRTLWDQLGNGAQPLIVRNAGGSGFWAHALRYNDAGRRQLVLGLADLEQAACVGEALSRLGQPLSPHFRLRLAVRMIESWLMADRAAFADFLGVAVKQVPLQPDLIAHPKRAVVDMARGSRKRAMRADLVPEGSALAGPRYTAVLSKFVIERWQASRAMGGSPSLGRAWIRWSAPE